MEYRNKPELQDQLAAEYVLGTLRGQARLRFQSWMREDARLRRAVEEWQARLMPMAEALDEVEPPKRVWRAVQSRIGASATAPAPARGVWDSLAFWRGWGLLATGCAAALLGAIALRAPQLVEVPVIQKVEVESSKTQPSYVAVLRSAGGKGDQLVFLAYASRKSDELLVQRLELPPEPEQHSYELWGLPARAGDAPKSLGLVPPGAKATIRLAAAADISLSEFPALAISVEPAGGSKTGLPTGAVIAAGQFVKF